jgi:hypothetical protein
MSSSRDFSSGATKYPVTRRRSDGSPVDADPVKRLRAPDGLPGGASGTRPNIVPSSEVSHCYVSLIARRVVRDDSAGRAPVEARHNPGVLEAVIDHAPSLAGSLLATSRRRVHDARFDGIAVGGRVERQASTMT